MIQEPYLSEEDAKKYLQDLLNELNKQRSSDK
jgi:polyhydroxyalkanoate synthesis regulator phasin